MRKIKAKNQKEIENIEKLNAKDVRDRMCGGC